MDAEVILISIEVDDDEPIGTFFSFNFIICSYSLTPVCRIDVVFSEVRLWLMVVVVHYYEKPTDFAK
jgi:hypothetical protein